MGLKLVFRFGWFLPWLQGTAGIISFALALLLSLTIYELYFFQQVPADSSLAQVSIKKTETQKFNLTLATSTRKLGEHSLNGDFWQVGVRAITWNPLLKKIKFPDLYIINQVSSRYLRIEQELKQGHSAFQVYEPFIDIWPFIEFFDVMGILDANILNLEFVPLADGTLYSVSLSKQELALTGLNEPAISIVDQWQ